MSIRSILRKISFLRGLYQRRPSFQAELLRREKERDEIRAWDKRLLATAFGNDLSVRYGPFAGMRYLSHASGSQVLPKILGSYEEPIHTWIEEVVRDGKYDTVIDVGCAEGYYAVGFARRLADVRVHAFDIDAIARERTKELAALNHVEERVVIGDICTAEVFQRLGSLRTLVFCDIEGAEDTLLDPVEAPRLRECALMIEAHDVFIDGITDRLIARFVRSHRIRMFIDYPKRMGSYDLSTTVDLSSQDEAHLRDEYRPAGMRFLFMEPI